MKPAGPAGFSRRSSPLVAVRRRGSGNAAAVAGAAKARTIPLSTSRSGQWWDSGVVGPGGTARSATTTPHTAPPPAPAGAAHDPRRTGAVLALARFEAREPTTATALAVVAVATGVIGQLPRDAAALDAARRAAFETPEKAQSCTTYGRSPYGSFPEWEVVRSEWAEVVDRLQSAAGGPAARTGLTIRQRVEAAEVTLDGGVLRLSSAPGQVTVGTRRGGNRVPEFAVARYSPGPVA
ncbi:hypothetical protein [Streptomyces antibioticus]|uniref:hypothetical protein n=1 Tax=Streptomyces antibioticus TaxID=1890 RepID=UPI003D7215AE